MDRAKAFAEAYDSGKEKEQSSSFDDPECVSDPDEPEEDTDRAAVGAGGDDGLTDREKEGPHGRRRRRRRRRLRGGRSPARDAAPGPIPRARRQASVDASD
jgi:hypothetical protein